MSVVIPTYGQAAANLSPGGAPQRLAQDVNSLAPLATTYHSPQPVPYANYVTPTSAKGSNLSQFGHFLDGLAHQTGSIAAGATHWLAHQTAQLITSPIHYTEGISRGLNDRSALAGIDAQSADQSNRFNNLNSLYKSGRISSAEYKAGLADINKANDDLVRQSHSINTKIASDQKQAYQATIDTSAAIITLLTAGVGGYASKVVASGAEKLGAGDLATMTAGNYLKSKAAGAYLGTAEKAIGRLAGNGAEFSKLGTVAQNAVQKSTAEVIATGANMSAPQIARTAAVNLAFKYPIYYNLISNTGDQLYTELQNKKYGDAVNTLAFNAALVLSGGPIGQAVKYLGKFAKGAVGATFGQTSFLDTVDKELFGGTGELYTAAKDNPAYAKALKTLEATHMSVTGNDPVAAAWRLINGERSVDGVNAVDGGAAAWLDHLVKWADHSKEATDVAKKLGLGNVILGRWTANNANMVANAFLGIPKGEWQATWDGLKAKFPNSAFANNPNLDAQISHYIANAETDTELAKSVTSIDAGRYVSDFPKTLGQKYAKDGFVVIGAPKGAQTFREGEGALATKFAEGNDQFFTKAVQPLPVLSTVGATLRGLGLSPQASSERTYQLFNENVAANLEKTKAVSQFADTAGETDDMLKKLSSYAHDPTRSGFIKGRPVTDLRQLTNKDIQTALSVTRSQATEIQNAISLAHIQVPLAVKGLGDRAVDLLYSTPGLRAVSRRFLKTQGILRFGANPFFQYLRVIPKTEILSASEGGGFIKTLWNNQAKEINATRNTLRQAGLLDEVGHLGNVTGAEAVEQLGAGGGRNLSKKLLPMQERSIAGIIIDQAKRMSMSTDEYITQFPDKAKDTIQMIAEYDKKSSFLNSPLARTLNVAIFPFRFDAKVLSIMGRNLAKTDLFTQVAFVKGMMGAHDWLNSPQGKAWYAQNADAIGLFKYITPFANFNEIFHSLVPGNDHSLGNFGQLGGLPFGWIPSLLDSEGLTQFNQPGVDAKTGQPFTKYIPKDSRGQVATAIQDMLSQMFSYPGATVGLPSKNKATLALAEGVTGAKSADFNRITPPGGTPATPAPDNSYGPLQTATVPQTATPINQVHVKPPKVSSRLRSTKKKKSEFTPQLLPGQSSLGQL